MNPCHRRPFLISLTAAIGAILDLLRYWHLPPVRSFFGYETDPLDALIPALLPARDRWYRIIDSRLIRTFIRTVGIVLMLWIVLDTLPGPYWLLARASVAASSGGHATAVNLYRKATAETRWDMVINYARHASHRALLRQITEGLAVSRARPLKSAERSILAKACLLLAEQNLELTGTLKTSVPPLLLDCADMLVQQKAWDQARLVFSKLVTRFPTSQAAQTASGRAEWRFDCLMEARFTTEVALRPYLTADNDIEHEYYDPAEGKTFLIISLYLAHLGRSAKELVADSFALTDAKGDFFAALGIQESIYDQGNELQFLESVRKYEGISIGPDLCGADIVFEVPSGNRRFNLKINGTLATTITRIKD